MQLSRGRNIPDVLEEEEGAQCGWNEAPEEESGRDDLRAKRLRSAWLL